LNGLCFSVNKLEKNRVVANVALGVADFDVNATIFKAAFFGELFVLVAGQVGETPFARSQNKLAARELVFGTTEGFDDMRVMLVFGADRENDLANVNTGNDTLGLAVGVTHTRLETICAGARKHLVDAVDVEGVKSDTEMERFFTAFGAHVFVDGNTASFKSFG
jgi:hypothetical protein